MRLFTEVCTRNLGHPEGVTAWARDHHLAVIVDPQATAIYGEGGSSWNVGLPSGSFVLALRSSTHACAVFGDKLDAGAVETAVQKMVDELKAAGSQVSVLKDDQAQTNLGRRHGVVYSIGNGRSRSLLLNVITNERAGGAYQATIQVGVAGSGSPQP